MSEKTFNLVVGIAGGVQAIACAVCAFIGFPLAPAVVAAVGVAETAVVEICSKFVRRA